MKIQFVSDLHLEFPENRRFLRLNPILPKGEILILAGDILLLKDKEDYNDFLDFCSNNFSKTYWIAGNHEFYHFDLEDFKGETNIEIRPNVFLLNNVYIVEGSVRFIFSTLWTKISHENARVIQSGLNDFHLIRNNLKRLTVDAYNELFTANLSFIKSALEVNWDKNTIVVTHHVPTFQNYPIEYLGSDLNQAFAVDLDEFIRKSNIDFWIYGHHHRNISDFFIGKTRMLTNQLGYVRSGEHKNFQADRIIEIHD